MASTLRSRLVLANQVVFDQVDIFEADVFTPVAGLVPADVSMSLLFNNVATSWDLLAGALVQDSQVVSGHVYWDELDNGAYGIRFLPNALGHWSLTVRYSTAPSQSIGIGFDVVSLPVVAESGLSVSFV